MISAVVRIPLRLVFAHVPLLAAFLLLVAGCGGQDERSTVEWQTSAPRAQGLDPAALRRYVGRIQAGAYGEIHSLLVVRNGKLVVERYFGGYDRETLHPVYSVTKSVTSLLVGRAADLDEFPELETRVLPLFAEYRRLGNADARKRAIELGDLLTMRAGFEWDELSTSYEDPRNPVLGMIRSTDWLRFVLDRPMATGPGTVYAYNSGCSILLGDILRTATGDEPDAFAERELFAPLGIERYEWEKGPGGVTNTGFGLSLRPRDMAKLGQLVLDGGEWQGERIVSGEWLDASTTPRVRLRSDLAYGYQWWLLLDERAPARPQMIVALGWGGQFVFVVPELDIVVVSTADDTTSQHEGAMKFIRPFLRTIVEG
jgi:CubicO group peptidase (beta-lactamase class C family)